MMSNRLQIAKQLLRNDGVLICAIDESELHCITIVYNPRGKNFSYTHEYA
jgi:adenine-specific DNA-methyltransferase